MRGEIILHGVFLLGKLLRKGNCLQSFEVYITTRCLIFFSWDYCKLFLFFYWQFDSLSLI